MATAATSNSSDINPRLYMSMELGGKQWKLGFTIGMAQKARRRAISACDMGAVEAEIVRAKQRFGLSATAEVCSCYEAGPDGFWIHRSLEASGIKNFVVDSASIEVDRRKRRAKSDGLDVDSLLRQLIRHLNGERKALRIVRVPPPEIEDWRQLHRDLETLKAERTAMRNRIQSLLATQGRKLKRWDAVAKELEGMKLRSGSKLGEQLKQRLLRESQRLELVAQQIKDLKKQQLEILRTPAKADDPPWVTMIRRLEQLRGIGVTSAWILVLEAFAWRDFSNRRQVGAIVGLTPTPYQSGTTAYEQGISKAGNVWMRKVSVQLAWLWLRWQPASASAKWFRRFSNSKRQRRTGVVGVARRLMIDLWRYTCKDEIPPGAVLSGDAAIKMAA